MLNDPPLSSYKHKFFIFNENPEVVDGKIKVPDSPGLGVTIKEDLIIREWVSIYLVINIEDG